MAGYTLGDWMKIVEKLSHVLSENDKSLESVIAYSQATNCE